MTSQRPDAERLIGPHAVHLGRHSHPCSYLPGRVATEEAWLAWRVDPAAYHELMDRGFRRSGNVLYRTVCLGCNGCVPLRVSAEDFRPSRGQRRALARNSDVKMIVREPRLTFEKHELYRRYLAAQHAGSVQGADIESLRDFLYTSSVASIEIEYRGPDARLLGVSICDVSVRSVSSVYHYFEPREKRRGLGVFSVLKEIELSRDWGIPWYYLGYWIEGCASMEYKDNYRPNEKLVQGRWQQGLP